MPGCGVSLKDPPCITNTQEASEVWRANLIEICDVSESCSICVATGRREVARVKVEESSGDRLSPRWLATGQTVESIVLGRAQVQTVHEQPFR